MNTSPLGFTSFLPDERGFEHYLRAFERQPAHLHHAQRGQRQTLVR